MASILEVGEGLTKHFNVFDAAPENERDGPSQQVVQNGVGGLLPMPNVSPLRSHLHVGVYLLTDMLFLTFRSSTFYRAGSIFVQNLSCFLSLCST